MPTRRFFVPAATALALPFTLNAQVATPSNPPVQPNAQRAVAYDAEFFPGSAYDANVPTPESLLGYRVGDQPASHDEILRCFTAWAAANDRAKLVQYAVTHEGRESFVAIVTSSANHARLDEIQRGLAKLADPRGASRQEVDRLAGSLPAVAWLAYSIHGDELSGADGSLGFAYHLIASADQETRDILDETIVIIDPHQNPDGRDRYIQMIREHRGKIPNTDEQSLLHGGYWPRGRTNHYYFDLNRDWLFAVHPETQGRIRLAGGWHPLLFVDAHEMGPLDTYLFSPAREPINPNLPERRGFWGDEFSKDQAAAFDQYGWKYYTGEWNENWYPGYTDAWGGYRGAVPILYEQAGVDLFGIKRPEGTVLTYREAAHHQAVSSLANVRTLYKNRRQLMQEFVAERRNVVDSKNGPYGDRVFALVPGANAGRERAFLELMDIQGFEVHRAGRPFTADATGRLAVTEEGKAFPAGTLLIPNAQPEGHYVAAMLEFDTRVKDEFLEIERREILRTGGSKLYDITAWNVAMLYDLDIYEFEGDMPRGAEPAALGAPATTRVDRQEDAVAYIFEGVDDNAMIATARLLERGVELRMAGEEEMTIGGRTFGRGAIVANKVDNTLFHGDWVAALEEVCGQLGVEVVALTTGLGVGADNPDLGGRLFTRLERPRIAIATRGRTSANNFGELWHQIDHRVGLPAALIDFDSLAGANLEKYNVLVVPSAGGGLSGAANNLRAWVRGGGTLIAVGGSAAQIASEGMGLSGARTLRSALTDAEEYDLQLMREWAAKTETVDPASVWARDPGDVAYPWDSAAKKLSKDELEKRDAWQRRFMPQGAIVAARTDQKHWLTLGSGDLMSLLFSSNTLLMAKDRVNAPVRLGYYVPSEDGGEDAGEEGEPRRVGWATLPEGHDLRLRMGGLLWPEAAERLANAAYVTQERAGRGQVILFAEAPAFRGATLGAARLFLNAVVYGPGQGGAEPIMP